jgi:putative component of membrane protein insertase Oxa1/YidC/SpoIIIJ protein YidD
MAKNFIIYLIIIYQRFISPYKGWHCIHAQIFGGATCSNYGLYVINENGVFAGLKLLQKRFEECSMTANLLSNANFTNLPLSSELIEHIQFL